MARFIEKCNEIRVCIIHRLRRESKSNLNARLLELSLSLSLSPAILKGELNCLKDFDHVRGEELRTLTRST